MGVRASFPHDVIGVVGDYPNDIFITNAPRGVVGDYPNDIFITNAPRGLR